VEPITKGLSIYIGTTGPIISENGGVVSYRGERKLLADRKNPDKAFEYAARHLPIRKTDTDIWRVTEVAIFTDVPVEEVRRSLEDFEGVKVNTTGFAIHIYNSGISKGRGLEIACSLLGISIEETVSIGDSENDVEMIERSGLGVAVKNASEVVRESADIVLDKNNGEGILQLVRDLLSGRLSL
jgi:hypothetical protein